MSALGFALDPEWIAVAFAGFAVADVVAILLYVRYRTADRLWLADDLVLTRAGHLVTLASPRWEPGTVVYDIAFLRIHVTEKGDSLAVRLAHAGSHYEHSVIRFDVPADRVAAFRRFVDAAVEARSDPF
jgi:hypothetical protein